MSTYVRIYIYIYTVYIYIYMNIKEIDKISFVYTDR